MQDSIHFRRNLHALRLAFGLVMATMADTCTAEENDGVLNTYFTFEIPIALAAVMRMCLVALVYAKPYLGLRQVVFIGGQAIQALLAVTAITQFF